ncbi:MAG: hypothetical protein HOP11_11450 [Saprospiraceae bacterium]|nr:hypothetical protein [Saprospiraceae bacterium]
MKYLILVLILIGALRCVDYSEVPVPAYLYIEKFSFSTTPSEGSNSHAFRDVWIYVNDEYYGAYEMPSKVPISKTGNARIKLYAGVRRNGITSQPVRYPMTAPYEIELNLVATRTDTIQPIVKYYDYNKFAFIENFDRVHFFNQDIDLNNLTKVTLTTPEETFEGLNSGEILLTRDNPVIGAMYDFEKVIPRGPGYAYIELDYKNEVDFSIGLIGYSAGRSPVNLIVGGLKPRSSWGKIYFDFTDIIKENPNDNYRIALTAQYDTAIALPRQYIRLDNFKLIYQ